MTRGRYAAGTEVSADRSKTEIEKTLARYGADQFMYGWEASRAIIGFRVQGKMVRLSLSLPDRSSDESLLTPSRRWRRSPAEAEMAYEQAVRQRWRALALVVKAKLEAIEAGIATFEEEFQSYIVLPHNSTVGDRMLRQVEHAYLSGEMPRMLPGAAPQRGTPCEPG